MRLHIVAVGKLKAGPHLALARHYAERLAWPLAVREVEEKRPLPAAELKEREGALLLAAVPAGAVLIALDEHGRSLTSPAFAQKLAQWRDGGITDLAFVIGGADGLADQVRQKARLVLSLGAMTWPHLMVRAMLAEQIYRAETILAGHPYHRA